MRKLTLLPATVFLLLPALAKVEAAEVQVGVTIGDTGVQGFHAAVCTYYHVPGEKVVVIRKRNIPDEHLPVVFFLAQRAQVSPDVIVDLRLGGKSWLEVSAHFGLTAEVFHVPVTGTYGPPYGKAYGYYKNRKREDWAALKLTDDEVVNLVNVKFLSAHYGFTPDEVVKLRKEGDSFVKLGVQVKGEAERKRAEAAKNEEAKSKAQASSQERKEARARAGEGKGGGRGKGKRG